MFVVRDVCLSASRIEMGEDCNGRGELQNGRGIECDGRGEERIGFEWEWNVLHACVNVCTEDE